MDNKCERVQHKLEKQIPICILTFEAMQRLISYSCSFGFHQQYIGLSNNKGLYAKDIDGLFQKHLYDFGIDFYKYRFNSMSDNFMYAFHDVLLQVF